MNKERLLAVKEIILKHRDRFCYAIWCRNSLDKLFENVQARDLLTDCNTVGCIAGWTCALFEPECGSCRIDDFFYCARESLELTFDDANFLLRGVGGHGIAGICAIRLASIEDAIERIDALLSQVQAPATYK